MLVLNHGFGFNDAPGLDYSDLHEALGGWHPGMLQRVNILGIESEIPYSGHQSIHALATQWRLDRSRPWGHEEARQHANERRRVSRDYAMWHARGRVEFWLGVFAKPMPVLQKSA